MMKRIFQTLFGLMLCMNMVQAKERIISLAPHITEMLFALKLGDQVVGVMKHSDYPEATKNITVIGDAYALNYEQILALKATHVYAWKSGTPEKQIDKLRSLGLKVIVLKTDTMTDIAHSMKQIAGNHHVPVESIGIIGQFESSLQSLEKAHRRKLPQVKVFYEIWPRPLMTVGKRHAISEAIKLCGGVNLFDDINLPTPTISREALLARKPQLILNAASKSEAAAASTAQSLFPQVTHATLEGDLITRMGPRFVQGVQQMCEAIDRVRSSVK